MQTNTIGFYLAGGLAAHNWKFAKVLLPGVTLPDVTQHVTYAAAPAPAIDASDC